MRAVLLACGVLMVACGGQVVEPDGGADATTQGDGGACIDLEPSAFASSCSADGDCVAIFAGTLCPGYNCICPDSAISASSQTAYEATRSKVPMGTGPMCQCPAFGWARCIASQCVFCPNPALHPSSYPPGCPDAGL